MRLPADVALGNADYYELVGFSDHRSSADIWYRLLNLGFRLPAGAGTRCDGELRFVARPGGHESGVHRHCRRDNAGKAALRPEAGSDLRQ